jgi:hypothetical protein
MNIPASIINKNITKVPSPKMNLIPNIAKKPITIRAMDPAIPR